MGNTSETMAEEQQELSSSDTQEKTVSKAPEDSNAVNWSARLRSGMRKSVSEESKTESEDPETESQASSGKEKAVFEDVETVSEDVETESQASEDSQKNAKDPGNLKQKAVSDSQEHRFSFRSRKSHQYYNKLLSTEELGLPVKKRPPQRVPVAAAAKKQINRNRTPRRTLPIHAKQPTLKTNVNKNVVAKAASKAKPKRQVLCRPSKLIHIKCPSVCRKFEVVARRVKELQYDVTWEEAIDQNSKPKLQPIFMVYDEMVDNPKNTVNDRFYRDQSQLSIQVPEHFNPKEFGAVLECVGKQMKKGAKKGTGWMIVDSIKEFHHRIFGKEKVFRSNGNGKPNQQASKNNVFLGPGYECPEVDNPEIASL